MPVLETIEESLQSPFAPENKWRTYGIIIGVVGFVGVVWWFIATKVGKRWNTGNEDGFKDANNGSREGGGGAWQAATVLTPFLEKLVDDIYEISRYNRGWFFDCGNAPKRETIMWTFVGLSGGFVEQRSVNQRFVEKYGGGSIEKALKINTTGCSYSESLTAKLKAIYTTLNG